MLPTTKTYRHLQDDRAKQKKKNLVLIAVGFVLGFVVSAAAILNANVLLDRLERTQSSPLSVSSAADTGRTTYHALTERQAKLLQALEAKEKEGTSSKVSEGAVPSLVSRRALAPGGGLLDENKRITSLEAIIGKRRSNSSLQGVRILVAIAAFDFNQIPHLEEVLDSYHDVCVAGAKIDLVIHATQAYPTTYIDLLNSRFTCENFALSIVLKPSSLRLHLVDCHRELFYDKINEYDLFIYTEEDIRVTPNTVATYWQESQRIKEITDNDTSSKHLFSDFNVGLVRYEYNYPSNVVIDDKTRHAIQNVTRVYWEHSSNKPPLVPNTVNVITQGEEMAERYVTMNNHHQGMFLATRDLLLAWKDRKKCNFNEVKNRPGSNSQPSEGTQRVWMSSQQLFGKRHCNVQQVLPKDKFGALTVLHVPNKNYRRVGKYRKREFSDGTETFEQSPDLVTAMQLHLAIRKAWPPTPQFPYKGPVKMVDEVTKGRTATLERRMKEYQGYAERGGILSDNDFSRTLLVETD